MGPTNIVAHELESYGVRTFSAKEMAFNILGLMHPLLFSITQVEPIWADLNGGMDRLPDLADITTRIRTKLNKRAELRRAIARDNSADFKVINGVEAERLLQTVDVLPRANFRFDFPVLESSGSLSDLSHLRGLLDLEKVVVITGFGEVGPWGSSRNGGRWRLAANLLLKAALRWPGLWALSNTSTVASRMDRCMLVGLTVRQMNPSMTRMSKAVTRRKFSYTLVFV